MAGPSYVSEASQVGPSGLAANFTINAPSSIVAGNLLLLFMSVAVTGAPGYSAPSGWTLLTNTSTGNNPQMYVYTKVATGSEPASYTWTGSGTIGNFTSGVLAQFSDAVVDTSALNVQVSTSSPTATSVTTSQPNELVVAGITIGSGAQIINPPSGTLTIDTSAPFGTAPAIGAYYETFASAGATGSFAAVSSAAAPAAAVTLALKSATSPLCMML